eukprot:898504-Pelagomonas_calceolata.AAC.2
MTWLLSPPWGSQPALSLTYLINEQSRHLQKVELFDSFVTKLFDNFIIFIVAPFFAISWPSSTFGG